MAEETFGGPNPQIGTGEGESPLQVPPEPKIDLRTMTSDLNSLKETGGDSPRPYTPPPPVLKPETPVTVAPASVFEPPKVDGVEAPAAFPSSVPSGKSKKGLFWGLVILIIILGLGAIGYFFVYPKFFAAPEATESAETLPSAPAVLPEVPAILPATEPAATAEPVQPATTPAAHVSLFKTAADLVADATINPIDLASLKQALQFNTVDVPVFKEIVLKDASGNLLTLNQVISVLLPNTFSADTISAFNPDLTVFVYSDKNGSWSGYVFKAGAQANLADLQSKINQLELGANLTNLFLTDPGTAGTTWKSGQTDNVNNRYVAFSTAGFTLNYGWVGDTLLISASYNGFKEAITRLK